MSGTVTVRELIVELLDYDMDDNVYIWHEAYLFSPFDNIQSVEWITDGNRPHGVYLIPR